MGKNPCDRKVNLTLLELSNVTSSCKFYVSIKLMNSSYKESSNRYAVVDGVVRWDQRFSFQCNTETTICKLSVLKCKKPADSKYGFVDINLVRYKGGDHTLELPLQPYKEAVKDVQLSDTFIKVKLSIPGSSTEQAALPQPTQLAYAYNSKSEHLTEVDGTVAADGSTTAPLEADSPDAPADSHEAADLVPEKTASDDTSCVLVIGTTGTGKSTTINICTSSSLPTGNAASAVTKEILLQEDDLKRKWIDNPGWSDANGETDAVKFRKLLLFLQKNKVSHIKAVIWNVLPQCRGGDVSLQAQARSINNLTLPGQRKSIWGNVVIISKGKTHGNEGNDCLGALTAAQEINKLAKPTCLSYGLIKDEDVEAGGEFAYLTAKQRTEHMQLLTPAEIRAKLKTTIAVLPPSVEFVLLNQRCLDCGQTGDSRLMDDMCHKQKMLGHPGVYRSRIKLWMVGVGSVLVLPGLVLGIMYCCDCYERWSCCGEAGDKAHCCKLQICTRRKNKSEGCQSGCCDVCQKCTGLWGNNKKSSAVLGELAKKYKKYINEPCVCISLPESGNRDVVENTKQLDYVKKIHQVVTLKK